jgi:hypothetical protein
MVANSVGRDGSLVSVSSEDNPCPQPKVRHQITTLIFYAWEFENGTHPVGGDGGVHAKFRVGSSEDTCQTPTFVTDWEGTISLSDESLSFEIYSPSRDETASVDELAITHQCGTVFELGNGCS